MTSLGAKVMKPPIRFPTQASRRNCFPKSSVTHVYNSLLRGKYFKVNAKIKINAIDTAWIDFLVSLPLLKLFQGIKQCYQFKMSFISQHFAVKNCKEKCYQPGALNCGKMWTFVYAHANSAKFLYLQPSMISEIRCL